MTLPLLFTPWTKRGVTLKNRVVVAPMHQYAADRGFITDWHLMNAGRFAAGGAGMVMVESTKVERRGCGTLGDTGLWDDAFIPGMKRVADLIRANGSPGKVARRWCKALRLLIGRHGNLSPPALRLAMQVTPCHAP
jgi:2,4-dienoyl-CoA reductase-like NADH-dependent reductase (Old Yellow Enzyme family)